jgi:hypothetical protein
MKYFEQTPRTEAAFYSRFQSFSDGDKKLLCDFYTLADDWKLFRMICRYYAVKRDPAARGLGGAA